MDTCILCKSSKKDDVQYGEFLKNQSFGVHTYCLYLSSNLLQNGKDDEGFLGFLEADIKKEVSRIYMLKCCYCNKRYANIGCCDKKCRRTFHFICGLQHNAENRFCHDFQSFCHSHVKYKVKQLPSSNETCLICYENLLAADKKFIRSNMILTPCCRNGWFHKLCLQKFAKTAGYFFKCPLCNDSQTFREKLPARGIFIPNQDAAWELEPDAFADLLERPSECTAKQCKHEEGRKAFTYSNPFVMCVTCGSAAIHRKCLSIGERQFYCVDCKTALEEGDSGRESLISSHANHNDSEDKCIDVCHISDTESFDVVESKRDSTTNLQNPASSNKLKNSENLRIILESSTESFSESDTSDKHIIKPIGATRRRRLKSEINTSDFQHTSKRTTRSNVKSGIDTLGKKTINKNRIISDSESSELSSPEVRKSNHIKFKGFTETDSDDQNDVQIKSAPLNMKNETIKPESSNKKIETSLSSSEEEFEISSSKRTSRSNATLNKISLSKNRIISDSESSELSSPDVLKSKYNKFKGFTETDSDKKINNSLSSSEEEFVISSSKRTTRSKVKSGNANLNKKIISKTRIISASESSELSSPEVLKSEYKKFKVSTKTDSDDQKDIKIKAAPLNVVSVKNVTIKPESSNKKIENSFSSSEEEFEISSSKRTTRSNWEISNATLNKISLSKNRKISDSESSELSSPEMLKSEYKKFKSFTGTDNDIKIKSAPLKVISMKNKTIKPESNNKRIENSLSSCEKDFVISSRKRKSLIISSDSEGETLNLSQQKSFSCQYCNNEYGKENNEYLKEFSNSIQSPNSTEKKNTSNVITQTEKDRCLKRSKSKLDNVKTTKYSNKKENIFDMSCIAKRTRSKSVGCSNNRKSEIKPKENLVNNSCIANRTRRSTICAQTNYSKESLYEMSQIYEKIHESDDDENKNSKFELSCIANRTRKRKSLRFDLPNINEFTTLDG